MKVAVVTANYGHPDQGPYDSIRPATPQQQTVSEVEWVYVTDSDETAEAAERLGWQPVVERRPHVVSNVAAKVPKFRPDLYTNADATLWVDAGADIGASLVWQAENSIRTGSWPSMSMFRHPARLKLRHEVSASRGLPKYDDLPLEAQIAWYIENGYPDDRLYATGCIWRVYRGSEERALHRNVGDMWLQEVVRWGFQDQLSFPWVAWNWQAELCINELGPDLYSSPNVNFGGHLWTA